MTTIIDSKAEAIIALYTDLDLWVTLHSADPGKTGANLLDSTDNQYVQADTEDWSDADDDATSGGRVVGNEAQLSFGNATAADSVTHFGLWERTDTDPDQFEFRGGAPVTNPQTLTVGQPVYFPIGALEIIGAGLSSS